MRVIYSPEGAEQRAWNFDLTRLRASEAEGIEKVWRAGGGEPATLEGWRGFIMMGSARAQRILVWFLLRKEAPTLKFQDFDPFVGEIEVQLSSKELRESLVGVEKSKARTGDEKAAREAKIEQFHAWIEEAEDEERARGEEPQPVDPTQTTR